MNKRLVKASAVVDLDEGGHGADAAAGATLPVFGRRPCSLFELIFHLLKLRIKGSKIETVFRQAVFHHCLARSPHFKTDFSQPIPSQL